MCGKGRYFLMEACIVVKPLPFGSHNILWDPGTSQQSRIQQAFVTSNILPATAPDPNNYFRN